MFWWRTESVRNVNKAEIHLYTCKTSKIPGKKKLEIRNELESLNVEQKVLDSAFEIEAQGEGLGIN